MNKAAIAILHYFELRPQFKSFLLTWLGVMAYDGVAEVMTIYNGDLSTAAFQGLLIAMLRATLKAIWIQIVCKYKKYFPNINTQEYGISTST